VHKYNWAEFRVAVHKKDPTKIMVGKVEMPDLTDEWQEVNMRNVTVSRRRHGVGMFKFSDERGFYSGYWRHGLRHGMGTEVNQQGRFQGLFNRDWRVGPGSQVSANGDSFRGPYGGSRHHIRESLIFGDEYCDGLRHGPGRMRFVDGSVYVGNFKDGVVCGAGRYVTSTGLVDEGTFSEWSALHGYGSSTVDAVTRIGTWRHGLLHGRGTEIDLQLGTYEGDFKSGEKHGFGELHSSVVDGVYKGWYRHDQRWGRGVLNFGSISRDKDAAEARVRKIALSMRAQSLKGSGLAEDDGAEEEVLMGDLPAGGGGGGAAGGGGGGAVSAGGAPLSPAARAKAAARVAERAAEKAARGVQTLSGPAGRLPDLPGQSVHGRSEPKEEEEEEEGDDDDAGEGGGAGVDEDGEEVRKSEYEKMMGKPDTLLPYRGDYAYEGKWRAGGVRTGGVFTARLGRTEPHLHLLRLTTSGTNPSLPGLGELAETEAETAARRSAQVKATLKEMLASRLAKERENLTSFVYWKRYAERRQKHVRRKTRRGKDELRAIVAEINKPKRVASSDDDGGGAVDDQSLEDEEAEEGADDPFGDDGRPATAAEVAQVGGL
jgi:hypothetical protein